MSNNICWWSCRFLGIYPVEEGKYSSRCYWRGVAILLSLLILGSIGLIREAFFLPYDKRRRLVNNLNSTVAIMDYFSLALAAMTPYFSGRSSVIRVDTSYTRLCSHFSTRLAAHLSAPRRPRIASLIVRIIFTLFVVTETTRWSFFEPNIAVYAPFVLLHYQIFDSLFLISHLVQILAVGYTKLNWIVTNGRFVACNDGSSYFLSFRDDFKKPFCLRGYRNGIGGRTPVWGHCVTRIGLDSVIGGHRALRRAESDLRSMSGMTAVSGCLTVFVHLFIAPYYSIAIFSGVLPPWFKFLEKVLFTVSQMTFTALNIVLLLSLAVPPSIKHNEACKTGYLITSLLDSKLPKNVSRKLKNYSIEILHDSTETGLDMCGLKLEIPLIKNMVHSVVLYVVILLQFS